jgi:hypothetical protein
VGIEITTNKQAMATYMLTNPLFQLEAEIREGNLFRRGLGVKVKEKQNFGKTNMARSSHKFKKKSLNFRRSHLNYFHSIMAQNTMRE